MVQRKSQENRLTIVMIESLIPEGITRTHFKFLPGSSSSSPTPTSSSTRATKGPAIREFSSTEYSEPTTVVYSETTTVTQTSVSYISRPAVTQTVYPCVNMTNFQGPAYGDANITTPLGQRNVLYARNDTTGYGASAELCCNACYFGVPNCVQANWYSSKGCIVSFATNTSAARGENPSSSCPSGLFNGLTYGPDVNPAPGSMGNIAGPCGQDYTNFHRN
ncbi:hypothetical protein F5Y13DRAFT_115392 [Hypoxylon sp. FL1857]|nr:hypothetical protein F5Y13DRAFT_115392 [Hypoxylon sp. FL1857]